MTKGVRATLIMLIVLSGLVAFVVYSNNAEQAAATPAPSLYVWDIASADVARVQVVDHAGQTEVSLSRDDEAGWQVESSQTANDSPVLPLQPADPSQGDLAASLVSTMFIQRTLTETTEIGEFGLEAPAYSLNVTTADGLDLSLAIGLTTPPGDGYYVLRDGDVNATIVNAGSIDPLLAFIEAPPLPPTPEPEVTLTVEGGLEPAPSESATPEP